MLKCLFRANANNNGVYLSALYDFDAKPIVIKKSSATLSSISRLKKEVQGTNWYSQISKEELISNIIDLPSYYSVNFRYISGEKADYRDGYWTNREFIEKALKIYCEIWSELSSNELVIHGDYSLDNLIFDKNNIVIIDWEHFSRINIPIGFDALNLIYEQLYFMLPNTRLDNEIIEHAKLMLENLSNLKCLDKTYWNKPLLTTRNYISSNAGIWGAQIHKLPIMKLTPLEVHEIDKLLCLKEI